MNIHRYPRRHGFRGFTLVELLVAMGLSMIIIGFLIYVWRNTTDTMRRATNAVHIHNRGRYVSRLLNETLENHSGCHVLFASDTGANIETMCADLAGIDSLKVHGRAGFARGCKWSPMHYNQMGVLVNDLSNVREKTSTNTVWLPTYYAQWLKAYSTPYTTGIWKANKEVFRNQTTIPTSLASHERKYMYRAIKYGKISKRDLYNPSTYTGTSEPVWPQKYGETVTDNGVEWMCIPPYLCTLPINIEKNMTSGEMGKVPLDRLGGATSSTAHPRSEHMQNTAWGWAVHTSSRTSIYIEYMSMLTVTSSAQTTYAGMSDPVPGDLEIVDYHDQKIYTGFRGVWPQGVGYSPSHSGDHDGSADSAKDEDADPVPNPQAIGTIPRQPRWVRIDYKITGEIKPGIQPDELPEHRFTQMILLR